MTDVRDHSESELRALYAEYLAGLGRSVPRVVHRQDRSIPQTRIGLTTDSLIAIADQWIVVAGELQPSELS